MYTIACVQWYGCIHVVNFKGLSVIGEIKLFHYNSVKQLKTTHQKCVFFFKLCFVFMDLCAKLIALTSTASLSLSSFLDL